MPVYESAPSQVRCRECGRIAECNEADLRVYRAIGPPLCCDTVMQLPAERPSEHRKGTRRTVHRDVHAHIRRAADETGHNLCIGVIDISVDGLGVRVNVSMGVGEEFEAIVYKVGVRPNLTRRAKVQSCRPIGGGLFSVGLMFTEPLKLTDVAKLVL